MKMYSLVRDVLFNIPNQIYDSLSLKWVMDNGTHLRVWSNEMTVNLRGRQSICP